MMGLRDQVVAGLLICLGAMLTACGGSSSSGQTTTANDTGSAETRAWQPHERPQEFSAMVSLPREFIEMRDGVRLSAHITLPADEAGNPVETPLPVILTQTGYNSSTGGVTAANPYFVQRGYAQVYVDVRGTGNSEGVWEAWGPVEQADYLEVMDWVAKQPWSDGNVGTWGPSFMAITQLLTAQHNHPAHKALFAIVPPGDVYRDITFAGGQINGAFELGVKTTLFDGAATFNAAAFYTEFANRQVSNFTLTGYVVGNAAESITQGVEADFRMALSERLTIGASAAWLDSYFTSFEDGPCTAVQTDAAFRAGNPDCRQDLSGEGTDYAPEVTASLTGQYVRPIGDSMEMRFQLDLNYTEEYYTTQDRDEADKQDAFYKINSRLSLMSFAQGWELALLGKNLTNEITTSHGNDVPLFVGAHFASTDAPRSVAVEGVLRF